MSEFFVSKQITHELREQGIVKVCKKHGYLKISECWVRKESNRPKIYYRCSECEKAIAINRYWRNPEKNKEHGKKYRTGNEKYRENNNDGYVRALVKQRLKLETNEIPIGIVNLYREILRIKRKIKELK